ncbi:helix-turn-helix domain-containing protein [uncultured Streptomyces sp.]|uniref:helix-turn-helix domain-containing protein n=1 Tax=uncultured Streptomyces sp. TaxID=174707 RepID=UPI00263503B8|nr:helix-turn-helix domain-containing protein [uncultured Streptomyces sp.]
MADEIGLLLRELRERAGLSQQRLEERSGISATHISRIETGKSRNVRRDTVNRLLDAMESTPEDRKRMAAVLTEIQGGVPAGPAEEEISRPEIRRPFSRPANGLLSGAAAELATETRRRWQREEEQRMILDPYPLPVRWRSASTGITDLEANIRRLPPGAAAEPLDLSSDRCGIGELYRSIGSGRLVILGRAGSGKSVLAIRLVLDLLRDDSRTGADPVPVIFTVGSWDPTVHSLRAWLTGRLLRDFPYLARAASPASTLAAALVDDGHVLPVLDGFDEMAEGLRGRALDELNRTSLPLVLTSRPDEYANVVRRVGGGAADGAAAGGGAAAPLKWAAAVELTGITPADLLEYMPRATRSAPSDGDPWSLALTGRTEQDERLRRVLSTPLMVFLARTVYGEGQAGDPGELTDASRFPTEDSLRRHLLAAFVPTVYRARAPEGPARNGRRPEWTPERSQRWFGHLARHLVRAGREGQDIAWWQIGGSVRTSTRALAVAAVSALCVAVPVWLADVLIALFVREGKFWSALTQGAALGLGVGITSGALYASMATIGGSVFAPSRTRLRLRGALGTGRSPVRTFAARFGAMLPVGLAVGVGVSFTTTLQRVLYLGWSPTSPEVLRVFATDALLLALILGLAFGTVFGLAAVLEAPLDVSSAATPDSLLNDNRRAVGIQLLFVAPALALSIFFGGGLVTDLLDPVLGPLLWLPQDGVLIGTLGGIGGGLTYALCFTAWGQWLIFTRLLLPLRGQLPWNADAFLRDAYDRGVLRRTGAVYQFRHIHLQRHLSHRPYGDGGDVRRDRVS